MALGLVDLAPDRDLGSRFPATLAATGLTVERHLDHFAPACSDEAIAWIDWRAGMCRARPRPPHPRYKPNELRAVMRHGVALLVIIGHAPHPDLAHAFVATLPRIGRFLARNRPPFIAKVYRPSAAEVARKPGAPGRVDLQYPK